MSSTLELLQSQRTTKRDQLDNLLRRSAEENRDLNADEDTTFTALQNEVRSIDRRIAAAEEMEASSWNQPAPASRGVHSKPATNAPNIGRGKADQKGYSLMRAIRLKADHLPLDGLEAEVHQEVVKRSNGRVFKGFAMPTSNDPELRALMYPQLERRDLTTVTGPGALFNVPKSFVELLRAKMIVRQLGCEILDDMQGLFSVPRQTGTAGVQWVGEGVSASPTNPTFDQIPFSPRLAIATTPITREFMMQSSFSAEEKVNRDLATDLALAYDQAVFVGAGGAQPLGLFNDPAIQANSAPLALGANGGTLTYSSVVKMKGLLASYNAAAGNLAYVGNSAVETQLRLTVKQVPSQTGSIAFLPVWEDTTDPLVGRVNGIRAYTTNLIPANFVCGTASNCSGLILANWSDLTIATWDSGVDVVIDPFTGKRAGTIEITMMMAMDSHPKHEQSFVIIDSILPS